MVKTTLDLTHLVLGVEGVLAEVEGLELVVRLQVRPPPHPAVDDVREALPVRHLWVSITKSNVKK